MTERIHINTAGYMNYYAWPGGAAYWGKPHKSRAQAENAARWCGHDGKRVVARAVVRLKPSTTETTTTIWVLAYTLRFPDLPGLPQVEFPQVTRQGYRTEAEARAAQEATGSPAEYAVCKVEVP